MAHLEPDHLAVLDVDASRRQGRPVVVGQSGAGVGEEGDVGAECAEHLRLVHRHRPGGQDADGLVSHLPAVAERAVQHVAAPPLREARDVRQFVDEPGRDDEPARGKRPGTGAHGEAAVVARHGGGDVREHVTAVAGELFAAPREQFTWRDAVVTEVVVHALGGRVAGTALVEDHDAAALARQRRRRAQTRRAPADHHHVH